MKFSIHGKVSANYDDNCRILHIYITGPVNEEFFAEYESVIAPIRDSIKHPYWGSIVQVNGDALISPEAISIVKMSVLQAVDKGLLATAVIFNAGSSKLIFKEFWGKLYSELRVKYDFFDHEEQAHKWLLSLLSSK